VLGVLPGLIGCAQATETLKVILGLGEVLRGRLWMFDALSFQSRILRFPRHPERALLNLRTAITATELAALLASEAPPFLLDVREPEEYYRGHLPGATLIPLSQVVARAGLLPRHHPIVVYCHRGNRSLNAITLLQMQAGFTNLQNLEGGLEAWVNNVEPAISRRRRH
jgi:adenylyltransferase/sulfurtransferase